MRKRLLDRLARFPTDDPNATTGQPLPSGKRLTLWRELFDHHRRDLAVLLDRAETMPPDSLSRELKDLSLPSINALVRADGFDARLRHHVERLRTLELGCLDDIQEPAARYIDWAAANPRRAAQYERRPSLGLLLPRSIREDEQRMRRGRELAAAYRRTAQSLHDNQDALRRELRNTLARMILPCAKLVGQISVMRTRRRDEAAQAALDYIDHHAGRVALFDSARHARHPQPEADDETALQQAHRTVSRLRTACDLRREQRLTPATHALDDLLACEEVIFDDVLIDALATNQTQCAAYEAMLAPHHDTLDTIRGAREADGTHD